jgi:hypothetical protein
MNDWVPKDVAAFNSGIIDDAVSAGWMAGKPATRIAFTAGIPRCQVGGRVMTLGLPARDHHLQPIEGSKITPMPRMGIDELIVERCLTEALIVDG